MKGWIFDGFGGAEKLKLTDLPDVHAADGEVTVNVRVAGVNPVDRSTIAGRFDWIKPPFVTGAEFAGEIAAVGRGVDGLSPGMKVLVNPKIFCGTCHYCLRGEESSCLSNSRISRAPHIIGVSREGGWREIADVPSSNIVPLPDNLPLRDACTLGVDGSTAWRLVRRARPRLNDFALVVGSTGGVGSFAVQIAKLYGCEVAAVVGDDRLAAEMKRLGADHVINRNSASVPEAVRELTGGRGADVVIDPVGASTFEMSSLSLAPLGRFATCGTLTGIKSEISLLHLYSMQVEYVGSTTFSRADVADAVSAMSRKKIVPVVDTVMGFEEIPAAMKRLDEHGRLGKVLVEAKR